MQLTKALKLLVVGLSAVSVAEATFLKVNRAAGHDWRGIERRQDDDDDDDSDADLTTSVEPPPETSSEPEPTTDEPPPTVTSTPTQTPTPTSPRDPTTSSSTPAEPTPTKSAPGPDPTTPPDETSSAPTDVPEDSVSISTVTHVTTKTRADGTEETLTTESVVRTTPGLADNGNNNQESGMSPQTRNTVIGVVVGVGGAIVLGGLAFVAWRIWGRKKPQEENDVLMDYGSGIEKPDNTAGGSMGGRTPFQSTLESYHAPTPNTAANF